MELQGLLAGAGDRVQGLNFKVAPQTEPVLTIPNSNGPSNYPIFEVFQVQKRNYAFNGR